MTQCFHLQYKTTTATAARLSKHRHVVWLDYCVYFICLCKSELLSVNLGNCGVHACHCTPGAVVIYRSVSRITAAPPPACRAVLHQPQLISFFHLDCGYKVQRVKSEGLHEAADTTTMTEITFVINVHGPVWQHIEENDIFLGWQCNTKHFSITFTWMFRLANTLLKLGRWRRRWCLYKSQNKDTFFNEKCVNQQHLKRTGHNERSGSSRSVFLLIAWVNRRQIQ